MRIHDLECLVKVVEEGGVTRAAEAMFMTQSSLSKSIARLEKALGVSLFDRTRRNLELTSSGRIALKHARTLLAAHEQLIKDVSSQSSMLRVGVLPILDSYGFASTLSQFSQNTSGIQINVIEMDNHSIGPALASGSLDAALYRPDQQQRGLYTEVLRPDELALLLPENHPQAASNPVVLSECRNEKFVILNRATQLYQASLDACHQAGFEPQIVYTGSSAANFARLVRENAGIALLLESVARSLAGNGLCVRRLSRQIRGDLCFVCSEARKNDPALQKLLNALKQVR